MSSGLVIRIIGGVCGGAIGTYISEKIYDYISQKPQLPTPSPPEPQLPTPSPPEPQLPTPSPPEPPKKFESKIKDVKSFEEIFNIQLQEQIENGNKYDYEYDNEHGNTIQFKPVKNIIEEEKKEKEEKEVKFINDTLYDNNYLDYYTLLFAYELNKEN